MKRLAIPVVLMVLAGCSQSSGEVGVALTQYVGALDPGVRTAAAAAGTQLEGMTANEMAFFDAGKDDFEETETVDDGIGPTMNFESCGGCHSHPATGGTSPPVNPQFEFATRGAAADRAPAFITPSGPVREVRFIRNPDGTPDGGVHALFTITGRPGADGCVLAQPDFATEQAAYNVTFRIPTPVFGAGLIEQIPDRAIIGNHASYASQKQALGIRGRANMIASGSTVSGQANKNGNDGTIARFGWKAQNKSLLLFSGEAYNVEMGITNELFQTERDETPDCQFATLPNTDVNTDAQTPVDAISAIEKFTVFMRFLAPPTPSPDTPGGSDSIARGKQLFTDTGCSLCHTPTLYTGNTTSAALRNKPVNLYSDLLIHDMGVGLADGVSQGQAGPRDFRTAPLWGLGQRIFFLHDGRTSDLVEAIQAHLSNGSEGSAVVSRYNALIESEQTDVLNFLRSL